MIPNGARAVVDARNNGMKPDELLIVSLIGRVNEQNHTIYANSGKTYDWGWLRGLKVCVYTDARSDWRPVLKAIADHKPAYLALWDADRREGAQVFYLPHIGDINKPQKDWRWKLDFLPWEPSQNREFAWS
jgi:hypothetical protein